MKRFQILRSSAGAGKTHQLVKEYLLRCLETSNDGKFIPNGFRHVLALTFTNKAAAEMRDRVIEYLSELAINLNYSSFTGPMADVAEFLSASLAVDNGELQQRCARMLKSMLHDRSALSISTIDAFTKKVTRPFTRELQLEWDQEMTADQGFYDTLAGDMLLDSIEPGSAESRVLMRACEDRIESETNWDLREPLQRMAHLLNDETTSEKLETYRAIEADQILRIAAELRKKVKTFEEKWKPLAKEGLAKFEESSIPKEAFSYNGEVWRFMEKNSSFNGETLNWEGARPLKNICKENLIAAKVRSNYEPEISSLEAVLLPIGERMMELLQKEYVSNVLVPSAILRELMMVATLADLERCLDTVKTDEAVLYFSDLTKRVSAVVQSEPTPFVYERIGERFNHILIDEFQDTSILQWQNLIPLAEEALSKGGSVLLVGDAKQAIYRWRNGEVRQFERLPEIFRKELLVHGNQREQVLQQAFTPTPSLNGNYRSGSAIINFNNDFFGVAKDALDDIGRRIYEAHEQTPKTKREGFVELMQFPKGSKPTKSTEEVRTEAMERVLEIVNECTLLGYAPSDICLLVRGKTTGTFAAEFLRDHGLKVSSSESFELGKDTRVQLIIEQLNYLDDPTAACAARIHGLLSILDLRADSFVYEQDLILVEQTAQAVLANIKEMRKRLSFYELVTTLIRENGIDPSQDMMLLTLLDLAQDHGKYGDAGIRGFLEQWERSLARKGVLLSADKDAVEIMTIHKSKGLARPVVIVPFAEMRTKGNHFSPLWIESKKYGIDHALVDYSSKLVDAELSEALEENELRELDELNLLYVAATRASHRLHILLPGTNTSPASKAIAAYIKTHGANNAFCVGNANERFEEKPSEENGALLTPLNTTGASKLVFRKEAPADWQTEDPDPYRTHGDRVHAIFEHLETADDLERAFKQAHAIEPLPDGILEKMRSILAKPEVRAFYTADTYGRNEPTLLLGPNQTLRPDRVIINNTEAKVLDIKTGAERSSHKKQVEGYKDALRELGFEKVEGYLLYLNSEELVAV